MTNFAVLFDGVVDAEDAGAAARKVAAHFTAIAEQRDTQEVDWDKLQSDFLAPVTIDIRPI